MWIAKPFYESLPYLYAVAGLALIGCSWFALQGGASTLALIAGGVLLLIGLVLWLRRRDYRLLQRRYPTGSLDE